MRPLLCAAFAAAVVLCVSSSVEACDRHGPNGWACSAWSKSAAPAKRWVKSRRVATRQPARAVPASNHTLVRIAARYIGTNPTRHRTLWCQDFVNLVLSKSGRHGTRSRSALDSLRLGHGVSSPQPGDIAVRRRGRGGHVGIVVAVRGNQILLRGGNQCGKRGRRVVCDSWQSKRIYRFRRV